MNLSSQLIYNRFYDSESCKDCVGLSSLRVALGCKQINPKEIRRNYYAADLLLDKVLDSMLVEFGSEMMPNIGAGNVGEEHSVDQAEGDNIEYFIYKTQTSIR